MSKYSDIASAIKSEINNGVYSDAGKLPTEYELVSRFGVSRQTIRQAITSLKAEGVVYQVQGSGTYVSKAGKLKRNDEREYYNILVVCTYISDYIFPSIVRGIESELSGGSYHLRLAATGNKVDVERRILNTVLENGDIDGIIVEGTKTGLPSPNIGLYRQIEEKGIPIVFLHCTYVELSDSIVVGMDDYAGGKKAVKYLYESGCKKLGAVFKSDDRQGTLRYAGFIDGLLECGLSLDNIEVRWYTTEDIIDHGVAIDQSQIESMKSKGIEGLVCYNDEVALVAYRNYAKYCDKPPLIVSFDNSFIRKASGIAFKSLNHKKDELGKVVAQTIKRMIAGETVHSVFFDWDD